MGIRVLHVLHAYRAGGMENMIAEVASRLHGQGFSLAVCALTFSDQFKARLPVGVEVFELNRRGGVDMGCILNLRKLVKRFRPHIVHSHNWNALVYCVAALAGMSVPLMHGEHAKLYEWELSFWRLKLRQLLYLRCDLVHTVGLAQLRELSLLGVLDQLQPICNGVDTNRFSPGEKLECKKLINLPADAICIGVVARFVPEKRHSLVLEAFGRLGVWFPNLFLVLVGSGGGCENDIRVMVEKHPASGRILWLGHRDDVANIYKAMDLLLIASVAEGMSNVCLEAMSCGVPALVNSDSGTDELIQDGVNGFVADMRTAEELANALVSLLENPRLLESVGRNARAKIEREYRLDVTAQRYASAYKQLADVA